MKFSIYSNLLIDSNDVDLSNIHKNEYCILNGDICKFENYEKYHDFLRDIQHKFKKIFIVNGPYEYTSNILSMSDCKMICENLQSNFTNVVFLDDSYVFEKDTIIFGSTLWTTKYLKFHEKSRSSLHDALSKSFVNKHKIMVISYFCPSNILCGLKNSKYYNNYDYYFNEHFFDMWTYSSTQTNQIVKVNGCKLITNNYGVDNFKWDICIKF